MAGNNGESYDNVPKGKRQLGRVITLQNPVVLELNKDTP
jgi:hypothetical protein